MHVTRVAIVLAAAFAGAAAYAAACVPDYQFQAPADAAADATAPDASMPVDAGVDVDVAVDVADAPPRSEAAAVDAGSVMVPIAAGSYTFTLEDGDGGYQAHTATVPAFAIDAYEVTVARWAAFVDAGMPAPPDGASFDPGGPYAQAMTWRAQWNPEVAANDYAEAGMYDCNANPAYPCHPTWGADPLYPIDFVSWYQAAAFCWWEGQKRLPTNTEWQVVASGQGDLVYPWGNGPAPAECTRAILDYDGGECGFPVRVGTAALGATANGVFDLGGSVSEWVWDLGATGDYPDDAGTAYAGPADAGDQDYVPRHGRGASYLDFPPNAPDEITNRFDRGVIASVAWGDFGFRCAKSR